MRGIGILHFVLTLCPAGRLCAQEAGTPTAYAFEVASVRSSLARDLAEGMLGGPGTKDPTQITYTNTSVRALVVDAFGIKDSQLEGPGWMDHDRYDVRAKIPPSTSIEQFRLMLQNLLAERFGMKVHHESRNVDGYELVVAKGGVKMKVSGEATDAPGLSQNSAGVASTEKDRGGLLQLPPGRKARITLGLGGGGKRVSARLQSALDIVQMCKVQTGRPVVDRTGLGGTYDFNLDFASSETALATNTGSEDVRPPFLVAIQSLGLKLQRIQVPLDYVVIEEMQRRPSEN